MDTVNMEAVAVEQAHNKDLLVDNKLVAVEHSKV